MRRFRYIISYFPKCSVISQNVAGYLPTIFEVVLRRYQWRYRICKMGWVFW